MLKQLKHMGGLSAVASLFDLPRSCLPWLRLDTSQSAKLKLPDPFQIIDIPAEAKLAKRLELLFSHACPVLQGRAFAREDHRGALDLQQLGCLRPPPGACAPVAGAVRLVVCDDIIGVERGVETAPQLGGACLLDGRHPTCPPGALWPCGLVAFRPPPPRSPERRLRAL